MATLAMKQQPAALKGPLKVPARLSLSTLFFGLLAWLADAQGRAAHRYDLRELDDRQLRDVGLTRAELDRALGPTFWMSR
ncbi:MAG: DUF1127 domain-containing protein [Oceanibaculum sp.]